MIQMLRIIGATEVKNCTLQIEEYIPVSVRCAEVTSLTPLYWRTGDFKKSLLEIGMDENTGAICKVTVPLVGNCSRTESEDFSDATTVKSSLPLCDISEWPKDRFKDEPFTFTTLIGKDSVLIWLTPTVPVKTIYEIGQVRFGADGEGNLRLLQFKNLSRVNLDQVTVWVRTPK